MRILDLSLKNIGPFKDAYLSFGEESDEKMPVTIITGENGTGKTIVLDAIRGLLGGQGMNLQRNIVREPNNFLIKAGLTFADKRINNNTCKKNCILETTEARGKGFTVKHSDVFCKYTENFWYNFAKTSAKKPVNWITNYWTSHTTNDSFEIKNLVSPILEDYLVNSLNGIQKNIDVVELICFFDYLKSSDNPKEKKEGEFLFDILKKIIKLSVIDGELEYVERKTLTPIISQMGYPVSIDKLSSGNLYVIQRLVSLLGQMYSVYSLLGHSLEDLCKTPGLLMIDEAENHLHPKWQKTFINSILDIFPNLQIIVTTHSPFIVSSVKNARVYVCKSMRNHSIIVDETAEFANKPIEEILLSDVFNTPTFSTQITDLMEERKVAIHKNDNQKKEKIEAKLKQLNPEYFAYFDVEKLLEEISQK